MAAILPGTVIAWSSKGASCKPPMFTKADVTATMGIPAAQLVLVPLAPSGIPPVNGEPPFKGKTFECDWELASGSQTGIGEGRVSLYAFLTAAEANRWFTAYVGSETPPCKKVTSATPACVEVVRVPGGVYPLFQAIQDRFVVWIHAKQRKLNTRSLKALATKVLVRAPRVT